MTAPWPYEDLPANETTEPPTWKCPEDRCACAPVEADEEVFEYAVMLTADDGSRMPGARVRVLLHGVEINRDAPFADEEGFVTFSFRRAPVSVRLEWAPGDTPIERRYPYRAHHYVTLHDGDDDTETDDAHERRLTNLGFHLARSREDNVEAFQHRYEKPVTRDIRDIAADLVAFHDQSSAPRVDTTSRKSLGPNVVAQDKPSGPRRRGGTPKGGGTPPGSGTGSPPVLDRLVLKISARFSLDTALSRRWKQKDHLAQVHTASVTLTGNGFNNIAAKAEPLGKKDEDVTMVISLAPVIAAGGGTCTVIIEPPPGHDLGRTSGTFGDAVGSSDRPTGLKKGDCLFRPCVFDIEVLPTGEVKSSGDVLETEVEMNGRSRVSNGATLLVTGQNTILVDWRPDYIRGASNSTKKPKAVNGGPGATLDPEMFICVHQTSTSGASVGSVLNTFLNAGSGVGIHYVIDLDGFTVKMANEDVQCTHVGGDIGAAWKTFVALDPTGPEATVASVNALTVGIEHVHEASTKDEQTMGFSTITDEQMDASVDLITSLVGEAKQIFTHSMVGLVKPLRLGHKPACIGTGYEWSLLENAGLLPPMTMKFTYSTPDDKRVQAWLLTNGIIDATADGSDVINVVQDALRKIGFFVPSPSTDKFDTETQFALRSFILRYFGGPSRASQLANVQETNLTLPTAGMAIVNDFLVQALFEARDK